MRLFLWLAIVATLAASVARAGGSALQATAPAYTPRHYPNNVECFYDSSTGRNVVVHAPGGTQVESWYDVPHSARAEKIYWRSKLYRWSSTNRRWYLYANSRPWLWGLVDNDGLRPWRDVQFGTTWYWEDVRNNNMLEKHVYFQLHPGYYRALEYFYWPASGVTLRVLANRYNARSASYCHV